jgi:hypothetical protein
MDSISDFESVGENTDTDEGQIGGLGSVEAASAERRNVINNASFMKHIISLSVGRGNGDMPCAHLKGGKKCRRGASNVWADAPATLHSQLCEALLWEI